MVDGRDSLIAKQRTAEKPETAADRLNTHGLRTCQLMPSKAVDRKAYHLSDDVLMYVATACPVPRAATADAIQTWNI